MKTPHYTINPLKWERSFDKTAQQYSAYVPMGSYTIRRYREGFEETGEWTRWVFSYCFDEYYDESSYEIQTVAEGKRHAWEDWSNRIEAALTKVE